MWFAPGACHAPHQAPAAYIDKYKGAFDQGWDAWREEVFARQRATGLLPPGAELSERPHWIPAWDSCSDDEQRLYARMMEVFAGFLEHTDAQVGRVLDFIDELGEIGQHDRHHHERQRGERRGRSAWIVQRELLLQRRAREP